MIDSELERLHYLSSRHEQAIKNSSVCGCFFCAKMFQPNEIKEWYPERRIGKLDESKTALCPHCGIDSVLPENIGCQLTVGLLEEMREHWFGEVSDRFAETLAKSIVELDLRWVGERNRGI